LLLSNYSPPFLLSLVSKLAISCAPERESHLRKLQRDRGRPRRRSDVLLEKSRAIKKIPRARSAATRQSKIFAPSARILPYLERACYPALFDQFDRDDCARGPRNFQPDIVLSSAG